MPCTFLMSVLSLISSSGNVENFAEPIVFQSFRSIEVSGSDLRHRDNIDRAFRIALLRGNDYGPVRQIEHRTLRRHYLVPIKRRLTSSMITRVDALLIKFS